MVCNTRSPASCPNVSLMTYEIVEVKEQHGETPIGVAPAGERVYDAVSKQRAISRRPSLDRERPDGRAVPQICLRSVTSRRFTTIAPTAACANRLVN